VSDPTWTGAPPVVDLRRTRLTSLRLSGGDVERLLLPTGLGTLDLAGRVSTVEAEEGGRWLRLSLDATGVPAGLARVRDLRVTGAGTISAAPPATLPDLRSLRLTWSPPRAR
jgi:hypothetical protein